MGKFTREVGESTFAPSVTQPIEQTDRAAAIQTLGGIVEQVYGGAQRARGREAAEQFTAETVTTALAPETGMELAEGDVIGAMPQAKEAEAEGRTVGTKLKKAKAKLLPLLQASLFACFILISTLLLQPFHQLAHFGFVGLIGRIQ